MQVLDHLAHKLNEKKKIKGKKIRCTFKFRSSETRGIRLPSAAAPPRRHQQIACSALSFLYFPFVPH